MVCAKCKSHRIHRIERRGFLRVRVAPLLGYFPWECATCGKEQLLKARGRRRHSHDESNPHEEVRGHVSHLHQDPIG